jgi:hypothetical protein
MKILVKVLRKGVILGQKNVKNAKQPKKESKKSRGKIVK